jgi:hypothetical protein
MLIVPVSRDVLTDVGTYFTYKVPPAAAIVVEVLKVVPLVLTRKLPVTEICMGWVMPLPFTCTVFMVFEYP